MTSRLRWVCCRGYIIRRQAVGLVFPRRRLTDTRACTVRYATRRRRSPRAAYCRQSPADELTLSRSSVLVSYSHSRLTPAQSPASSPAYRQNLLMRQNPFKVNYFRFTVNNVTEKDKKTDQQFVMYFVYTTPRKKSWHVYYSLMNTINIICMYINTSSGAYTAIIPRKLMTHKITVYRIFVCVGILKIY